jgi:hypothetical protein
MRSEYSVSPPSWLTWPYRWAVCWVPVKDDENLLRLVIKDWYKPKGEACFGRIAFQPNNQDTDGISLYRERFVSPAKVAASRPKRKGAFYVVQLKAGELRARGLTLRPVIGELPGHVVIPQLKWSVLKENRNWVEEEALELVKLAQGNIRVHPSV